MDETDPLFVTIDKLIRISRLKEIEFIMGSDRADRIYEIQTALRRLEPGHYLLGTGPSTVGIIHLDDQDIVLGRPSTILEPPSAATPDYWATDTLYFVPREVSRNHVRVALRITDAGPRRVACDLNSTCGTFVNDTQVDPGGPGIALEHGDIISLGPSRISTYVYYEVP
ncbi:MAG: FHA domain-containing protein [Sedimentisphaerales bacterium]|jgi:pSer/pThr/pTyr-binding forkhead associated (FHA) protein|nr:FHA domain-containing protein [Planctomycetota bacterium]MDY0356445.1 FHA domain-containing protein [Sedimentisphaerales bacterium]NLT77450.1 FHA domain-containing protein [Planctomycetota bacterium]